MRQNQDDDSNDGISPTAMDMYHVMSPIMGMSHLMYLHIQEQVEQWTLITTQQSQLKIQS